MVLAEYNMLSRKSNACLIQATVLLVVPYETQEEDVAVVIEKNYLLAGVRGQQPIVKTVRQCGHAQLYLAA